MKVEIRMFLVSCGFIIIVDCVKALYSVLKLYNLYQNVQRRSVHQHSTTTKPRGSVDTTRHALVNSNEIVPATKDYVSQNP